MGLDVAMVSSTRAYDRRPMRHSIGWFRNAEGRSWLVAGQSGATVFVVVAAFVAFLAVACGSGGDNGESAVPPDSTGSVVGGGREVVVVIGDSITHLGQAVIEAELGSDREVIVDGRSGFRVDQQQPSAERMASGPADQVIIELGTNDVMQGWDPGRSANELGHMVGLFSQARCIHLVMINESMPSAAGEARSRARRLNVMMKEIALGDPRINLIDVPTIMQNYEAADPDEPFTFDGVHPTEQGQVVLVDAYGEALDACQG